MQELVGLDQVVALPGYEKRRRMWSTPFFERRREIFR